jgi:hypothetical protein
MNIIVTQYTASTFSNYHGSAGTQQMVGTDRQAEGCGGRILAIKEK